MSFHSGTTFCGGWIDYSAKRLYVANIGDSSCCLFTPTKFKLVHPLHTPENPLERKRIEAEGGKIHKKRIFPSGLNITRSLGDDHDKKYGLNGEPDFFDQSLLGWNYVLFGSDGVFDYVSLEEITQILGQATSLSEKNASIVELARKAWIRKSSGQYVDDITSILVQL